MDLNGKKTKMDYEQRKKELNAKANRNKNKVIQRITDALNDFYEIQQDLKQRHSEVKQEEKNAAKKKKE